MPSWLVEFIHCDLVAYFLAAPQGKKGNQEAAQQKVNILTGINVAKESYLEMKEKMHLDRFVK